MEIRPLDVTDDSTLQPAFDLVVRSELVGRPIAPQRTWPAFAAQLRGPDSGERIECFGGFVDDRLVAVASLFSPLLDNTEKVYFDLSVEPDCRRRGHGRMLTEHLVRLTASDGRSEMITDAKMQSSNVAQHPYSRFARSVGFTQSNIEVVRHLEIPIDDHIVQGWLDAAAERAHGYRIETFVDVIPDDLVPGLCTLIGQLAVDAPSGEVDFEEQMVTPARFAEMASTIKEMDHTRLETLAIALDGTVAAHTTLVVPNGPLPEVHQWGTFVHRDHRGHRLGLAVKAANHRELQDRFPDKRRIITQNAETNDHMVAINELMGFEPAEVSVEFVRRL